jgi:hypothetical protein
MNIIEPRDLTLNATTATVAYDAAAYGSAWQGEWSAGSYSEGDVVYKDTTIYEALTATSEDPEDSNPLVADTPEWLILGEINPNRMLDQYIGSYSYSDTAATSGTPSTLTFSVDFSESISHVAMFGLSGQTVEMWITRSGTTVWGPETRDLLEDPIRDWEEYYFNALVDPITDFSQPAQLELAGRFHATITNSTVDGYAAIGKIILGRAANIGRTKYGISSGILDYSKKTKDDFGRTYLASGNFVKLNKCELLVEPENYDIVQQTITKYRATAVVWDANQNNTDYVSFVIYGFPRDFRLVMETHGIAVCSLDIEGLI